MKLGTSLSKKQNNQKIPSISMRESRRPHALTGKNFQNPILLNSHFPTKDKTNVDYCCKFQCWIFIGQWFLLNTILIHVILTISNIG